LYVITELKNENLDKYKDDLVKLISVGKKLDISMKYQVYKTNVEEQIKKELGDEKEKNI
jgi:hypothetical protein